jgi:hypothetical protein
VTSLEDIIHLQNQKEGKSLKLLEQADVQQRKREKPKKGEQKEIEMKTDTGDP